MNDELSADYWLENPEKLASLENDVHYWKVRALKAEKKVEALDWLVACAEEVVTMFPKMTMRTIGSMCKSIDLLKEACGKVK